MSEANSNGMSILSLGVDGELAVCDVDFCEPRGVFFYLLEDSPTNFSVAIFDGLLPWLFSDGAPC